MIASRLALLAPIIAGSWTAFNGVLYAADSSRRYRAESAWFVLAAVLLAIAVLAVRRGTPSLALTDQPRVLTLSLVAFLAGAVLLYFSMLSIGLLSDDFTLLARARTGTLADPAWEFLRPFPLAIWRMLDTPARLHAFNIALHAVNAWLTSLLAARFGLPPRLALVAGALFLVNPVSVEPVAWPSGIFDVLLTTLILASCALLTTVTSTIAATSAVVCFTAAALLTKETAVVMPAMLAVTAICSPRTTLRRSTMPIAASVTMIGLYFPLRIISGYAAAPPAANLSGYALKEIVSRPFGTLGLPFHGELLTSHPWLPFVFALLWPALTAWSATKWHHRRRDALQAFGCSAWIVASVLPLATMLFIADDLQGARYVYLGSAAFSILLAVLLQALKPSAQLMIALPVIALFIVATRAHQSPWRDAAAERDRVLAAYRNSDVTCSPVGARGLPDHVRGAYVFRNGFAEAVDAIRPGHGDSSCVAVWDGTQFRRD